MVKFVLEECERIKGDMQRKGCTHRELYLLSLLEELARLVDDSSE